MRKTDHVEQMIEDCDLLTILAESVTDVQMGRVAPIQNTFDNLRKILDQKDEPMWQQA